MVSATVFPVIVVFVGPDWLIVQFPAGRLLKAIEPFVTVQDGSLMPSITGIAGTSPTTTEMDVEAALGQALAAATETLTVAVVDTVMLCVVAPVDQMFPVAALEVKVTELPVQKLVGPLAVITGVAKTGFMVKVKVVIALTQFPAFLMVKFPV